MTTLDTRPAALDALGGPDALAQFRASSTSEITSILRELRDTSVRVILNGSDGTSYSTTLWTYDSQAKRIAFSADEHHVQPARLVDADDVIAVAYLDSVKVQFDVQNLVFVRGAQACVLQGTFPRTLYRFQRRNGYRVKPLERLAPTASFRHPSIPDMTLSLRIIDVSIGGCALALPADVPPLRPGIDIHAVHVDLGADTRFTTGIQLRHVSSASNGEGQRLGCEWLRIDGPAQRSLQRYIDSNQKRRRLLSLD